jgi:hypothetical protein|uniref:Uncharacterized protein n=1 Tax=Ignisphaera aggregans TaxID=334771 RepID=A0A7J2U4N1_9CREN
MIEMRDAIMYIGIGAVIGLAVAVLVIPYALMPILSPVLVGAGFVAFLAVGIVIGRGIKPKRLQPRGGRAYPLSMSEVGVILEMAMKSIRGEEK